MEICGPDEVNHVEWSEQWEPTWSCDCQNGDQFANGDPEHLGITAPGSEKVRSCRGTQTQVQPIQVSWGCYTRHCRHSRQLSLSSLPNV
ncbi:hypothetical protein QTP70_008301, partial [Hemibagrus guttatus]